MADETVAVTVPSTSPTACSRAIEAGRPRRRRALYAAGRRDLAQHRRDRADASTQNLRVLAWMVANLAERRYERRPPLRHRRPASCSSTSCAAPTRRRHRVELPACIVATVDDGRITRLDEYLDSAHVARLTG